MPKLHHAPKQRMNCNGDWVNEIIVRLKFWQKMELCRIKSCMREYKHNYGRPVLERNYHANQKQKVSLPIYHFYPLLCEKWEVLDCMCPCSPFSLLIIYLITTIGTAGQLENTEMRERKRKQPKDLENVSQSHGHTLAKSLRWAWTSTRLGTFFIP